MSSHWQISDHRWAIEFFDQGLLLCANEEPLLFRRKTEAIHARRLNSLTGMTARIVKVRVKYEEVK